MGQIFFFFPRNSIRCAPSRLSLCLARPVGRSPMASSAIFHAVLQKHGSAGVMDHLSPMHKAGEAAAWTLGDRSCLSGLLPPLAGPMHCQPPFITCQQI
ncbi:hypothetical protein MHYP_G00210770 [Metynnis hypsauchen]